MPIDTSIYENAVKPVNPLEMMSSIAGLQGAMQQNQLRARTMASTQAIGSAYQQATGPDGRLNVDQAASLIAHDPNAAFGAEAAAANLQAQRQAQLVQHVGEVELGMKQSLFMADQLGSLADTKGVTGKDITNLAAKFVQSGIIDGKAAATELKDMPVDDAQLPNYLRGLQKRSMDSAQQLAAYHQKLMADTGGQLTPVNVAPLGDQGPVEKSLSPGEASQPVAGPVTADGAPTTVPLGQRANMGIVQTGQSPSQSAAAQVTGAGNAQRAQDLGKAAAQVPDTKAILGNMSGDLKQFSTGPGASQWKNFVAGINRIIPGAIEPGAVASQENFNKLQTLLAQRSFAALGGTGTDAKLESAIHANPNESVSVLGNQGIIALNKGFADALALKNNLWQKALKAGQNPDTYGQFENEFNQRYDPRVFQFQYLDKAGQAQALDGMTSGEKAQFYAKQHYAEQKHWIAATR